jgi:hypothetical protein
MVFNATFNNISAISWRSVLLVEETGIPGENQQKLLQQYNISESSENIFFVRALEISRKANCCRACLAFYGAREINSIFTGNVCILCISCKKKSPKQIQEVKFSQKNRKDIVLLIWKSTMSQKKNYILVSDRI